MASIIHKAAYIEYNNHIPNKQVWLLESWFLHIILVLNDIVEDSSSVYKLKIGPTPKKYENSTIGVPLII